MYSGDSENKISVKILPVIIAPVAIVMFLLFIFYDLPKPAAHKAKSLATAPENIASEKAPPLYWQAPIARTATCRQARQCMAITMVLLHHCTQNSGHAVVASKIFTSG